MLTVRAPCCPLHRQQRSNALPVGRRQRWQPGNGQRIGQVERRIRQGDRGHMACASSDVRLPGLPLVLPTPL